MAKKKASKTNVVNFIAILLAVLSIALFVALPMIKQTITLGKLETVSTYGGFGMIFGGKVSAHITSTIGSNTSSSTAELEKVGFNAMAFISLLLVVLGLVATLMTTFVKSFKGNKLFTLVAGALLVVGGVLMLTLKGSSLKAIYPDALESIEEIAEYTKLGIGAIISAILAMVAGAGIIVFPLLKK